MGFIRSKWQSSNEDERKELEALGQKYASFLVNHSDDIRSFNLENNFVGKENVDWDIPFVLVVGNYNVNKPNASIAGNAFMEWRTKPGVEKGLQLGGGYTTHFSGSGPDLQLFSGFKNIVDFAKSVSTEMFQIQKLHQLFGQKLLETMKIKSIFTLDT